MDNYQGGYTNNNLRAGWAGLGPDPEACFTQGVSNDVPAPHTPQVRDSFSHCSMGDGRCSMRNGSVSPVLGLETKNRDSPRQRHARRRVRCRPPGVSRAPAPAIRRPATSNLELRATHFSRRGNWNQRAAKHHPSPIAGELRLQKLQDGTAFAWHITRAANGVLHGRAQREKALLFSCIPVFLVSWLRVLVFPAPSCLCGLFCGFVACGFVSLFSCLGAFVSPFSVFSSVFVWQLIQPQSATEYSVRRQGNLQAATPYWPKVLC